MIEWICAQLAKCFNAHLTDEDRRVKQLVNEARQKAQDFNDALSKLPRSGLGYIHLDLYGKVQYVSPRYFKINKIEYAVANRKEL